MSRKSLLLAIGIFALFASAITVTLVYLVRYEPRAYVEALVPPGEHRKQKSREFLTEFTQWISYVTGGGPDDNGWNVRFSDEQINSYFAETFVTSGLEKQLLPDSISQPRVLFDQDTMRVAFRYGKGFWSTIVSVDMKAWVAKDEPNVVALQLVGFHAGALPISAQSLLEPVIEVGRQHGIEVSWYRHESYPVALLRFQADQPRPTLELLAVKIEQGAISIQGRSNDGGAPAISTRTAPPGSVH